MSSENLNRFLHELVSNKELQEKINLIVKECNPLGVKSGIIPENMASSIRKEIVKLAQNAGYDFSVRDLKNYEKEQTKSQELRELSENELYAVAAGKKCACIVGGGGESGENDSVCACFSAGSGFYSDGDNRCACVVGGGGKSRD